jgi:hypothetical protein
MKRIVSASRIITMSMLLVSLLTFGGVDQFALKGGTPVQHVQVDSKDVQLTMELLSPEPLPYQAVRLRICLRNISTKRLGPIIALEELGFPMVKGPDDADYPWRKKTVLIRHPMIGGSTTVSMMAARMKLYLDPGEQTSIAFAMAADWKRRQGDTIEWTGSPLFTKPGRYTLTFRYMSKDISTTLHLQVHEPQGADKAVADLLKDDAELADALMSPVSFVPESVFPKLQDLLKRYPKTSYTEYARFALARAYRSVSAIPSERVKVAMEADELDKIRPENYQQVAQRTTPNRFPYIVFVQIRKGEQGPNSWPFLDKHYTDALEWLEEYYQLNRKCQTDPTNGQPWPRTLPEQAAWLEKLRKRVTDDPKERDSTPKVIRPGDPQPPAKKP